MKRALFVAVFCCLGRVAFAADTQKTVIPEQENTAIVRELAQRSGLPEKDLKALLSNCDANQQSMYFCAWRDKIAAERNLDHALQHWKQARDKSCSQSAKKEWGGGSMASTAQILCATAQTEKVSKYLERRSKEK